MPVRVIQTGLPGATFDDTNGSPFMPALAQAGNTLLELGPRLAQIRMQQQAAERQQGNVDRQFGMDQQRFGLDQQRVGFEGQRVGLEGQRVGLEGERIGADIRGQRQRNIKDLLEMGGGNAVADTPDAQALGMGQPLLAPIVSQANDRIAMQRTKGEAENRLTNATADYTEIKPDIEAEKARINEERYSAEVHEKEAAREQALAANAVKSVDSMLQNPLSMQFKALEALPDDDARAVYRSKLIEKQKGVLDPSYVARKQQALLKQLQGIR